MPPPIDATEIPALAATLDQAGIGVLACDASGRLTTCNSTAVRLLGTNPASTDIEAWIRAARPTAEDGRPLVRGAVPFPGPGGPQRPPTSERLVTLIGDDGAARSIVAWGVPISGGGAASWITLCRPGDPARTTSDASRARVDGLDRRLRRHVALLDVRLAAVGARGLDATLATFGERVRRDLPAEDAAIIAFDTESEPDVPKTIRSLHARAVEWLKAHERPLTVDAPALDPFVPSHGPSPWPGAWTAIPIVDADGPIGALHVIRAAGAGFDADDMEFLDAVARLAGAAIARARFIARLRRQAEELERHRDHLEELVAERTRDLETSHARIRASDRLAAIGTFTAGLGHDMNNVLFPIRCRIDALGDDERPEAGAAAEVLDAVEDALGFLQELTDGLRQFSRDPSNQGGDPHTELAPWWRRVEPLLRHAISWGTELSVDLSEDLPAIAVPSHGLTQAVLNLLVNASTAMKGAGSIRISAVRGEGDRVHLSIADDGPGMSDEVAAQIFDPFFSTGTRTKSTGLGLWIVHQVAERAGGRVVVDTEIGRGTTFTLSLPVVPAFGPPGTKVDLRIVVDDDDHRRRAWLAGEVEDLGYTAVFDDPPTPDDDRPTPRHRIRIRGTDDVSMALIVHGAPHDAEIIEDDHLPRMREVLRRWDASLRRSAGDSEVIEEPRS